MELESKGVSKIVEANCSVKIAVNAKGLYSGELKVYATTIDEAMSIAKIKAEELESLIRVKNGG